MFGILTMFLRRLVNHGHSFKNAKDLFDLLAAFPIERSSFHLFQPCQNLLIWPRADKSNSKLKQLSLLKYDKESKQVKGEFHSGISVPIPYCFDCREGLKVFSERTIVDAKPVHKENGKHVNTQTKLCCHHMLKKLT